jgi:hypothetical protein
VVSDTTKRPPWDQRLAEGLVRESWEAANNPAGRLPNPPLREQFRSPYFKLAMIAWVGAFLTYLLGESTWVRLVAVPFYLAALVMGRLAARDARAASLLRNATKENK